MQACPAFIDGEWREITGVEKTPVYNPSRGEVIAEVPLCTKDHVDEAVESAHAAFPAWRDTPPAYSSGIDNWWRRISIRFVEACRENMGRLWLKRAAALIAVSKTSNTPAA